MAKYRVHFEIDVIVDEPHINVGCDNEVVYNETGHQTITDEQFNEIVGYACMQMDDLSNNITEIVKEAEEED